MRSVFLIFFIIVVLIRVIASVHSPLLDGKHIRLSGNITTEPKEYGTSLLITLHDYHFIIPQNPDVLFGSAIVVEGVVEHFDLTKVKLISVTKPTSLLSKIRAKILETIRNTLPEPYSALLAGATIGAPNIPKDFADALRRTGTSHIVVASGGNLAILAGFLEALFSKFLRRRTFLPLIALVLLTYSALTGFGAPIVRALIMWLAICSLQYTGRVVSSFSVLMFTVLLMLFYKPLWVFDVSFQLSIGATAGILLLGAKLQKMFKKLPLIRESLSMSMAAQIGILPVSIFVFHDINLLSPLWNTLVLWTVPYITIIGMMGSVAALLFVPVGKLIFLSAYPFTWYFVRITYL